MRYYYIVLVNCAMAGSEYFHGFWCVSKNWWIDRFQKTGWSKQVVFLLNKKNPAWTLENNSWWCRN